VKEPQNTTPGRDVQRGQALRRAADLTRQAIAFNPFDAEAHNQHAHALGLLGRFANALESCDRAIALKPDFAAAHNNRGNALRGLGRPEEALSSFDQAIAVQPDFAEAHGNRGSILSVLGQVEAAVSSYDTAIALRPGYAEAHYNRGNAQGILGRPEAALESYDRAIALRPDFAEAHVNRGSALQDLDRLQEALASYRRAIALKPDFAEAYQNQSLCHLAMGDYEPGWKLFEWRFKARTAVINRELPGAPWSGDDPIENKTILVRAEQGFGDSIQFCRYVPMLASRATVVLELPRPLTRLLSGLAGVSRIIANGDRLPAFDAWVPMMSLPLAFRTTVATIPATIPYLHAEPERSAAWRQRLATLPGFKVGLVWAGSPQRGQFRFNAIGWRRSITLDHYAPLSAIPGLCLVSLQKGEAAAQATTPPEGMTLHDWTGELNDFADTADLIEALDLVITVDTAVAHLAGALGKPVWVLNRYDQCWRWLRDRDDSPWYPTARLFRQRTAGDWPGVIRDVAEALRRL
jgi:Flp pilus assembly protein TadD